eukprot:667590-Rhodomonas_salina.2
MMIDSGESATSSSIAQGHRVSSTHNSRMLARVWAAKAFGCRRQRVDKDWRAIVMRSVLAAIEIARACPSEESHPTQQ